MKKKITNSTQAHLDIAQIRDKTVILRDGSLRMVLMANSINFALKSEQEQNAIIFSYQNFLNSLTFPIQIVMQSRRLDLDQYLVKLKRLAENESNELIRMQTEDYIEFISKILNIANIMDKRFYIVLSFVPPEVKKRSIFDKIFHPTKMILPNLSEREFHTFQEELTQRVSVLSGGLSGLGIRTGILNTQQLVELFYATYNPEEATKEKLTPFEALESPVIEKE